MLTSARLIVLILGLLATSSALADNWKDCGSNNPDRRIKSCSAIIKAGRLSKTDLAIAYSNRGSVYHEKGEYDRAIKDYDKAIALNPKNAISYYNRGSEW